jgi:OmcA/MtrC family decaheme c-type cytochrome
VSTPITNTTISVVGASAGAVVKPTVVMSLYGYDSKDFLVTGHGSQPAPDGKRNLEWTDASTSNSPRLTVVAGATAASFVATADLTTWASMLTDGSVKRAEIGILPVLGLNQAAVVQADPTKAGYNPAIAIAGVTKTFDLVAKALVADSASYGRAIVDPAKCNTCHDALGTTFHSPSYGSAGVLACRLCHVGLSGGSHLEMQSRSIDSYVHAIHSFQYFDTGSVDFKDPVAKMRYEEHTETANYPMFSILNCESCHNAGTYEVPDQSRSLPGILSAADTLKNKDRAIGAVPSYVTGPASRACGSCHRAEMINEDKAGNLAAFNKHTADNGFMLVNGTGVLDAAVQKIMALFK